MTNGSIELEIHQRDYNRNRRVKMRRIIVMLLFLAGITAVFAEEMIELGFCTPAVQKKTVFSWLNINTEQIPRELSITQKNYDLAVSSPVKFATSIKKYLSRSGGGQSFFSYYLSPDKPAYLLVKLRAGSDFAFLSDGEYNFMHYGWEIQGRISERLSLYSEFWAGHFSDDDQIVLQHSDIIDSWVKRVDNTIHLDNVRGKLHYRGNYFDAALGRGKYEIGSSIGGSIILSDFCNDYGYLSFDIKLGDFRFSTLHSGLTPDSTSVHLSDEFAGYRYAENKYLTLHNLSWKPSDKSHFFIGEEVIYGAQATELSYLLPYNFTRAIEHNLGDHHNVLIHAGWECFVSRKWLSYGNLLLDELRKSEIFGDWWGNKYALQLGGAFYPDKLLINRLALEFTAVRPWIYTHKSIFTKYSHSGRGLGFVEGGNLMQIAGSADWNITDRMEINCLAAFIRQGGTGNSWEINYQEAVTDIDNQKTPWFEGNPENRLKLQTVITWQPLAHHWLKLGLKNLIYNDDNNTEFYLSWLTKY